MKLLKKLLILTGILGVTGCSTVKSGPLVIWTDNAEFASYTELFNASQKDLKAVCVYKQNLLEALPPKKGEQKPDILAGTNLRSGISHAQFAKISGVFSQTLTKEQFYQNLLESGKKGHTQYLLPVSFNMPLVVYSQDNYNLVNESVKTTEISLEQLKSVSKQFNQTTKDGVYTKMGFAPQWNTECLYLILASKGKIFNFKGNQLIYNTALMNEYRQQVTEWTKTVNTSSNNETDFAFKYLYTPSYKQILQNRSLFAFDSSKNIIALPDENINKINFKWVTSKSKIFVLEDDVMAGIYRRSGNKKNAVKFLQWFFKPQNQEKMIIRKNTMNLDTVPFGIAGGFSGLIEVNERILPVYYQCLMANLPQADTVTAPCAYPSFWPEVKEQIVIPSLVEQIKTENLSDNLSITNQYSQWLKERQQD